MRAARRVAIAFHDQVVERGLRADRFSGEWLNARRVYTIEDRAFDALRVPAHVDERKERSVRTPVEHEFWITERCANVVEIVDGIDRVVEREVGFGGELGATGLNDRIRNELLEIYGRIGLRRKITLQQMRLAHAAVVHQDNIIRIVEAARLSRKRAVRHKTRKISRCLPGAARNKRNGVLRRTAGFEHDDVYLDDATALSNPVFIDAIGAAGRGGLRATLRARVELQAERQRSCENQRIIRA